MKIIFKSIGAVLAGFLAVFVLSVGTDFLLQKLGVFPPQSEAGAYLTWMLALALVYRSIYTVLGGYITAALAPARPMRHVFNLGMIGIVFATLGTVANWEKAKVSGTWYPIALIALSLPCVLFGGSLKNGTAS